MKIKSLISKCALLLASISFGLSANEPMPIAKKDSSPQQVKIKIDLSSPVVLEQSQEKNYLKVSLTGFPLQATERTPINLALVIDRSTSMSGDRIVKAREAAILAVNMLSEKDTLSIIAYDNNAYVIVPAGKVTNKERIIKTINDQIQPTGMTALFAGVSKGLDQVNKHLRRDQVNRIILLSDGQANKGPTSNSDISELGKMAAKKGIAISTIGLGSGYNEDLMTRLAGYSDGNHAFVDNSADLESAFSREFNDVMSVIAQDVIVTITLNNDVTPVRLLGRDGEITNKTVKVKLNQLYSNQEKYVLLEVIPAEGSDKQKKSLAKVDVSYDNLYSKKKDSFSNDVTVSYTKSTKDVQASMVEDVLVESEIQKAAIVNEEAIRLMDSGRVQEAKLMMSANASELRSLKIQNAPAQEKIQASSRKQAELAEMLDKDANYSRKAVKEQVYSTKNQQQKAPANNKK